MRILDWRSFAAGSERIGAFAAAIGVFDGVHLGHRKLISRILGRPGLVSVVVTFAGNPKRSLHGAAYKGDILTQRQRVGIIASLGVDVTMLIDFSSDFSKLPGKEFLSFLSAGGDLRYLAVGHDFRCGHRLDTGADEIESYYGARGVEVEVIRAVRVAGHPVSSSRIRNAIAEGRLEEAEILMGRSFEVDLRGASRLEAGGLRPEGSQASPPEGVYEAEVTAGGSSARVEARLRDGAWEFESASVGEPDALRPLKLVSRE